MNTQPSPKKYAAVGGLLVIGVLLLALTSCDKVADVVFEARCEAYLPAATVEVVTVPIEFTLDTSRSIASLTSEYPPDHNGIVLGITKANLTKDLSFDNTGLEQPGTGRLCTRPQVKVVLAFTPMQVLIASTFPPGSCKYNEIYAHEMRHVEAYTKFLPTAAAEVQEQLTEALGDQVHYFQNEEEAQNTLETLLNSMWMPYLTEKMEQVEQEQDKIDTLEEYDRLAHVCFD
jgi:hypothetical protein